MECNKTENLSLCTCTYPCSRKGMCCECVSYHRRMRQIPGCFFSPGTEGTYDRSYEYFAECVKKEKF